MGNPILSDDAVGVRLALDLHRALSGRTDVDVVPECSVGGLNLLDYIVGYQQLVVLDAIHTRGGVPGTVYRFDATGLRRTAHLCNIHDANFATALALGRCLGLRLPRDEDIHVFAVEVLDDRTFGHDLSPPLARAYPACRDLALAEVLALLQTDNAPDSEERHGTEHRPEGRPLGAHSPVAAP
jgi:hydrogenase maturation protease